MSSDFQIPLGVLFDTGLITKIEADTFGGGEDLYEGYLVQFQGYEYLRVADIDTTDEGVFLTLSCGGQFRTWLIDTLRAKNITFRMF